MPTVGMPLLWVFLPASSGVRKMFPSGNYPGWPRGWPTFAHFCWFLAWPGFPGLARLSEERYDLWFSLTIVAMLLISPLGWMYYFPCLLIPLAVAWRSSNKTSFKHGYKLLIAFAFLLTTIPQLLIYSADMNDAITCFVWAGFYFYSLLLFSGILIYLAHHSKVS